MTYLHSVEKCKRFDTSFRSTPGFLFILSFSIFWTLNDGRFWSVSLWFANEDCCFVKISPSKIELSLPLLLVLAVKAFTDIGVGACVVAGAVICIYVGVGACVVASAVVGADVGADASACVGAWVGAGAGDAFSIRFILSVDL